MNIVFKDKKIIEVRVVYFLKKLKWVGTYTQDGSTFKAKFDYFMNEAESTPKKVEDKLELEGEYYLTQDGKIILKITDIPVLPESEESPVGTVMDFFLLNR